MRRAKQVCGLESAQVRKEEAVTRHFRLSCVAQSLVQRVPAAESKSERYAFAAGKKTYGQKCRAIYREALRSLLELCKRYFAEGKSCDEVLEVLMPVRHEAQGRNERTAKASSSMSLYRQAMSRWVVAMKGCKLIVKQLTLKGTGEA